MLVGIISTKFYNLPNSACTPELWPLNCQKTELAVSAIQVEYPAPQKVVITIEFTTNRTGVFYVSLAFLLNIIVCKINTIEHAFLVA